MLMLSPRLVQRTRPRTPGDGAAGRGRVLVSPLSLSSLDASVNEEWSRLSSRYLEH